MTRTVTILTLMVALIITGCETTPTSSGSSQQANKIQQNHKARLLQQIDRKYENPEAHYQLAKLYQEEGLLNKADFEFRVAVGFNPVHYRAQAGLVKVLTDSKQADRARVVAELYTSQTAVSAENSIKLGRAFQNEGLGEHALNCYFQAVGLTPKDPEPYKLIGYHYLDEGDLIRAEEYFRRSFELDPYQSDVSGELGRIGVIIQTPRKAGVTPPQPPAEE